MTCAACLSPIPYARRSLGYASGYGARRAPRALDLGALADLGDDASFTKLVKDLASGTVGRRMDLIDVGAQYGDTTSASASHFGARDAGKVRIADAKVLAELDCIRRGECPAGYGVPKWLQAVGNAMMDAAEYVSTHDAIGHIFMQICRGVPLGQAIMDGAKLARNTVIEVGPYIQLVASCIPGFGTALSVAVGAAVALAKGEGISKALMSACKGAIPGGPIVVGAFEAAAAFMDSMWKTGGNLEIAALEAVRAALPNDACRLAFDTAIAMYGAMVAANNAKAKQQMLAFGGVVELSTKDSLTIRGVDAIARTIDQYYVDAARVATLSHLPTNVQNYAATKARLADRAAGKRRIAAIVARRPPAHTLASRSQSAIPIWLPAVAVGGAVLLLLLV